MKKQIFSTNATHKLASPVNGTDNVSTTSVTLSGTLGGGVATLQFSDGDSGYVDVASTGATMIAGDTAVVVHGLGKKVFLTIAGGTAINAIVQTSAVYY
jgi:hypothetical protein